MFTGEKWPLAKWVHHGAHVQRCQWSSLLRNRVTEHGVSERPGAERPDHRLLGDLLFPYTSPIG